MEKKLMNFNQSPYDLWTNLKTAEPVPYKEFEGLYEFCKATSLYNFDKSKSVEYVPPLVVPICQFSGDWIDEVREMTEHTFPATFDYRAETRRDNNNTMEYNDFKKWGYNVDGGDGEGAYTILNRTRHAKLTPTLQKMADIFKFGHPAYTENTASQRGVDSPNIKFDVQKPGQMFYWHLDNFGGILKQQRDDYNKFAECDYDQRKLMRVIIFLEDQQDGQVWKQGDEFLTWKKGDCITWPWRDIPHGTANFSHCSRPTLNVTGRVTDNTLEFLKTCPKIIEL
jgi:hypothetical protein